MSLRDLINWVLDTIAATWAYLVEAVEVMQTESFLDWPLMYLVLAFVALSIASGLIGLALGAIVALGIMFRERHPKLFRRIGWAWDKATFDTDRGILGAFVSALWAGLLLSCFATLAFSLPLIFAFLEGGLGFVDFLSVGVAFFVLVFVMSLLFNLIGLAAVKVRGKN